MSSLSTIYVGQNFRHNPPFINYYYRLSSRLLKTTQKILIQPQMLSDHIYYIPTICLSRIKQWSSVPLFTDRTLFVHGIVQVFHYFFAEELGGCFCGDVYLCYLEVDGSFAHCVRSSCHHFLDDLGECFDFTVGREKIFDSFSWVFAAAWSSWSSDISYSKIWWNKGEQLLKEQC